MDDPFLHTRLKTILSQRLSKKKKERQKSYYVQSQEVRQYSFTSLLNSSKKLRPIVFLLLFTGNSHRIEGFSNTFVRPSGQFSQPSLHHRKFADMDSALNIFFRKNSNDPDDIPKSQERKKKLPQ